AGAHTDIAQPHCRRRRLRPEQRVALDCSFCSQQTGGPERERMQRPGGKPSPSVLPCFRFPASLFSLSELPSRGQLSTLLRRVCLPAPSQVPFVSGTCFSRSTKFSRRWAV